MEDTLRVLQWLWKAPLNCLNPCFNGRYSQSNDISDILQNTSVLILVLMEDTLRVLYELLIWDSSEVLILVLMEDTLRGVLKSSKNSIWRSLNPCFNGRYSQSKKKVEINTWKGLNPCFNGRYSQRETFLDEIPYIKAGLNPCFNGRYSQSENLCVKRITQIVLILVLMEDTLRELLASE